MVDIYIYNASQLDMEEINNLAKQAATRLPDKKIEVVIEKKRIVQYGFLNLRKREEIYKEKTWKQVDHIVLHSTREYCKNPETEFLFSEEETWENDYCLRNNGDLFVRCNYTREIIRKNPPDYLQTHAKPEEKPMTEQDVRMFDYKLEHDARVNNVTLLYQQQGEGLCEILNNVGKN